MLLTSRNILQYRSKNFLKIIGFKVCNLLKKHRRILRSTCWLDCDLIDACQNVLSQQFKHKICEAGFQSVAMGLGANFNVQTEEFIQILHNGSDHWITITTIVAKHPNVFVYDSLYSTVNESVITQISNLICTQNSSIRLSFVDVVRQSGISDCGVFAVAYTTSLCFEVSPSKPFFQQTSMREHIYECLEEGKFTMFPISKYRRQMENKIKSQIDINGYWTCRIPARNPMIKCNSCHEWFHIGPCVTVSKSEMDDKCFIWHCNKCTDI